MSFGVARAFRGFGFLPRTRGFLFLVRAGCSLVVDCWVFGLLCFGQSKCITVGQNTLKEYIRIQPLKFDGKHTGCYFAMTKSVASFGLSLQPLLW